MMLKDSYGNLANHETQAGPMYKPVNTFVLFKPWFKELECYISTSS